MAMIPRSSSHPGGRGVCFTPTAGLTQGLGRQNAAESTCQVGGVPSWGLKRLCLLLPLPNSQEAAKPGQTTG